MNFWNPTYIYTGADLEEDHDDEDGVADGEDAPEDSHCLGVPHELGGVVVGLLVVVGITLHCCDLNYH